jgi:pimeloyl-ACP methyl ester carboxylesterase
MESALRVRSGGSASQDLSRRMAVGFQRYGESDREGAVDGFLTPVFGSGYRQTLDELLPAGWEQAVNDADMFFGVEVPELQRWRFGQTEAARIGVPVLSMVGGQSDPAFSEMEELLLDLLPNVETACIPKANHRLCLQEPQAVAEALALFFAKHPLA